MTVDAVEKTKIRIFNTILNAGNHANSNVVKLNGLDKFAVRFNRQYVADFEFEWCSQMEHYRVYILIASTTLGKERAGYPICTIKSGNAACEFVAMYNFLVTNRPKQRKQT